MNLLKRLRPVENFKSGLLPLLQSLSDYLQAWSDGLRLEAIISLDEKRDEIMATLIDTRCYPEWVFDAGFNPGLRAGFRFFLIKLDQVIEIIFSINYLIHRKIAGELMQPLTAALIEVIDRNNELVKALRLFLKEGHYPETASDFMDDISSLEVAMQKEMPNDLEALGISPDYIAVTNLVRDMKDMRLLLIELIMSLPQPEMMSK